MTRRRRRLLVSVLMVAFALLVTRYCLADILVRFLPPHVVREPAAAMDGALTQRVDTEIDRTQVASETDALRLALRQTGAVLHFGLSHKTKLDFGAIDREGNCIEYAHLFATIFNRTASVKGVSARAYVVHSDAKVFGRKLPWRGYGDHDWVVVAPTSGDAPMLFVDPTFDDFGLDWNIRSSVVGSVRVP